MSRQRLFVYGTLRIPELLEIFFGQGAPTRLKQGKAILKDHRLYTRDGYYFLRPEVSHHIEGEILSLTDDDLKLIDFWEDVPLYRRERVDVDLLDAGGMARGCVWSYFHSEPIGEPVLGAQFSSRPLEEVLMEARRTLEQFKNSHK